MQNYKTIAKLIVPENIFWVLFLLISFATNFNDFLKVPFSIFSDKKVISDRNGSTEKKYKPVF